MDPLVEVAVIVCPTGTPSSERCCTSPRYSPKRRFLPPSVVAGDEAGCGGLPRWYCWRTRRTDSPHRWLPRSRVPEGLVPMKLPSIASLSPSNTRTPKVEAVDLQSLDHAVRGVDVQSILKLTRVGPIQLDVQHRVGSRGEGAFLRGSVVGGAGGFRAAPPRPRSVAPRAPVRPRRSDRQLLHSGRRPPPWPAPGATCRNLQNRLASPTAPLS